MKKTLITGGAGFVGRHLCKALLDANYEVTCVDSIVPLTGGIDPETSGWPLYNPFDYKNFKFLKQDCRAFFETNNDTDFDYVFHLAAMVGGREMIEYNPLAVAEDLAIDSMFWKWAKKVNCEKVICFSSSASYPIKYQARDSYKLLHENMIDFSKDIGFPDLSYGWAKLTNEYLGILAYKCHGIKSVTFRPFSGYGEDQDMAYPFPSICARALREKNSHVFRVWGTGEQMRDFIHIEDCIKGILLMMDKINDGSAVNLSTGKLSSFKTFAKIATNIVGYNCDIQGTSDKPEGVFARGGDTSKQESLNFIPKITLDEGIERGLKFIESLL